MKKLFSTVLILVLAMAMFTCVHAEEQKTISIWHIQTDANARAFIQDSIRRFEEENPGYKVEETCLANEDYKSKIVVALGSDTAPDIFITWTGGGMIEYVEAGQIQPLTKWMEADNYKDYFLDGGVAQATLNGDIWAVPVENCSIACIFYNSALFEELGLTVPTTVEELEAVCDKLVENGIIPFGLPNKSKYFGSMYYMYLVDRMAGPELFASAAARTGVSFEDEVFVEAAKKLADWAAKGYFGDGYTSLDGETGQHRQMFYNRECAMILDGSWVVSSFYNEESPIIDDIKVFPFPAIEGGKGDPNNLVGTLGDTFYCINAKAEDPDGCFKLIQYLIDETAVEQRIAAGRIPPTKNAYVQNAINEQLLKILQAAPNIQLWYDQYLNSSLAELHKDELQAMIALETTPEEYCAAMEEGAERFK